MDTQNVVNTPAKPAINYQKIFRLVAIAIVAVIVIALVVSIIVALIPGKFKTSGKNYILPIPNDDGEYSLIFNGKEPVVLDEDLSKKISGSSAFAYDYENKYAFVIAEAENESDEEIDEEIDEDDKISNEFYVISSKGAQKIADDVAEYELSAFGNKIYFINDEGDLYVGKVSDAKKAEKIDDEVDSIVAVSPDGNTFVYAKVSVEEDEEEEPKIETEYFISKNSKKGEKYDNSKDIIAISNNAKYVYYSKTNDEDETSYYVNDTKLAGKDKSLGNIYFNRDGSQALINVFDKENGETTCYLVEKAKEPVKITKDNCYGILAPSGASGYSAGTDAVYNTSTFAKCALRMVEVDYETWDYSSSYYYLKNTKGENEKLSDMNNANQTMMLDDGKTVLFISSKGKLKSADITKPTKEATEYKSNNDIVAFSGTSDGEHIYVIDEDENLGYVKNKNSMKKVASDVNAIGGEATSGFVASSFTVTDDGKVYYVNEDGDFYRAGSSGNPKKIGSDAEAVFSHAASGDVILVTEDSVDIVNGTKTKKLVNIE